MRRPSFLILFIGLLSISICLADDIVAAESYVESDPVEEEEVADLDALLKEADADLVEEEDTSDVSKDEPAVATEPLVKQEGPFIDLLGEVLLSLEMVNASHAELHQHYTNEALEGKKVIGLYFSADWCGPCRQFTPDLVNFYNKMNERKGKQNEFEIVWVSRCRDYESWGQYFTHMNWLAMSPEEAMGERGQMLSQKYNVKGIPSLVLLDEVGSVITTDARNKIPMDKAGIGFPWRNPIAQAYISLVPKAIRSMIKSQITDVKTKIVEKVKQVIGIKRSIA